MDKNFAGKGGFIWWTGIIEDIQDPIKMGRCKVRIVGWHSDNKMSASTDSLPWTIPLFPINNTNPYAPNEGDMVMGFFIDGESALHPVMIGVFPNIPLNPPNPQNAFTDNRTDSQLQNSPRPPQSKSYNSDGTGISIVEPSSASLYPRNLDEPSTPRMARNDSDSIGKTFIQERKNNVVGGVPTVNSSWSEPVTEYSTKYPYNNVRESESGHIFEVDDTPGKERIHEAHRTGTFREIYPNGSKVEKIVKDNYQIVMGDDFVYIMGKCNITVQGDAEIYVKKDAYLKVDGNLNEQILGNVDVTIGGNYTVKVGGYYNNSVGGLFSVQSNGYSINSIGSFTMKSIGNVTWYASRIDVNP